MISTNSAEDRPPSRQPPRRITRPVFSLLPRKTAALRSRGRATVAPFVLGALILATTTAIAADRPAPEESFERQVKTALASLAGKGVAGLEVLYLSADVGPWIDTGLQLQPGDKVTWILEGKSWRSHAHDLWLKPSLVVWGRIGTDGQIIHGTRDTLTFTADRAGSLQLRHWAGPWQDEHGTYVGSAAPFDPDSGGVIRVAVIRWGAGSDPAQELQRLAESSAAPSWAAAELARQRQITGPLAVPGWHLLGATEMFHEVHETGAEGAPQPRIEVHTLNDGAILQKDVALELTPQSTLEWKWKLDKLPSQKAENVLSSHDYISIAVKFDNGQDLTYFWSSSLPAGESFRCPFPTWTIRETHLVARTGSGDLGKWLQESRNVSADYQKTIGGKLPNKITQIWLIGTSVMSRSEGLGEFGEIWVGNGKETVRAY